tara:strand:- start:159 stop:1160 length:1002 start_codon:yes stop_codon:yes gene_type:complete
MTFNSIDEITEHFDLDSIDLNSIKKVLKKKIKKLHPDDNEGKFKSNTDEENYHTIHSALEFIKTQTSNSLTLTKSDLTQLTSSINKLSKIQNEKSNKKLAKEKDIELDSILSSSVQEFVKKTSGIKITGIAITTAITALWSFPSIVKDHPILSFIYEYHKDFTIFYVITLFLAVMLWIKIKNTEKKDKEIKNSYKLESVQNQMFTLFSQVVKVNFHNTEHRNDKIFIIFTKDDLIHFLMNKYEKLKSEIKNTQDSFQTIEQIKWIIEKEKKERKHRSLSEILNLPSLATPGEIDLETAQTISELIITRLKTRNLIVLSSKKSLSDKFEYEFKY